jgi:L-iditol 2-dehydrogenase
LSRLPSSCTFEQAALAEPLSVALHATRRGQLHLGQTVLVIGAGAVGLLVCALARAAGASRVAVTDIDQRRLAFAQQEGFATDIYTLPRGPRLSGQEGLEVSRDNSKNLLGDLDVEGFDAVFECTGVEPSIQLGIFVRPTVPSGSQISLYPADLPSQVCA